MDENCEKVGEIEREIDFDSWIQEFNSNSSREDGNAGIEGSAEHLLIDAKYVNVAGCSEYKSSEHVENKTYFMPGLPWNSKPINCNSGSRQARTTEAPGHKSCAQSKPSTAHNTYYIVESSEHTKNSLKSLGNQVSQSQIPQPNQVCHLLMQNSQQLNNRPFAGKWQTQPQHTSGFQSRLSSLPAHPFPFVIPQHSHPTAIQKDSSLVISPNHTFSFPQKSIGNSQGSTSSTPRTKLENSTEWSDHAYQQLKVMKDMYWVEVIGLYKKAQESCRMPLSTELSAYYHKSRVIVEKIIRFLQISKVDFVKIPKEKVLRYMNTIPNYLDYVRMKNSAALQKHLQQLQLPKSPPIMQQTGNVKFQFNQSIFGSSSSGTQPSLQQELSRSRVSPQNYSGEISINGREGAEALSRCSVPDSSKWPMHRYMRGRQQNANIAAPSECSSQSAFGSAMTLSQQMKQPTGQAISFLGKSGNALFSPSVQLQELMQLEGQTVTEQKPNEINEPKVKHILGSSIRMLQHNNLISKQCENSLLISPSSSSQLQPASPQNSQHSFTLSALSSPLTPSSVSESSQRFPSSLGTKSPKVPSELSKLDSLSINTPGICNVPSVMQTTDSEDNQQAKRPIKRLLDVIGSISEEILRASVCDIGNVVDMVEMRAGAFHYGGSRCSMGDDLMADLSFLRKAKLCRHETIIDDRTNRDINSITSNAMDWVKYGSRESDTTATSIVNCPNTKLKSMVLEEIKETNRKLVETIVEMVVDDSEDVTIPRASENIIIRCSHSPMGYHDSRTVFPEKLVLQLLILSNYPNTSPLVLDNSPDHYRDEEVKYGYKEVKSRFNISLCQLSEPMSITQMAKTWDFCAREVFSEFAKQTGGGSFSSTHGIWEKCDTAA